MDNETQKKSQSTNQSTDRLIVALSYAPLAPFNIIFCIINLMSKNAYQRFHGAQAFVYWAIVGLVSVPVSFIGIVSVFWIGQLLGAPLMWFATFIFLIYFLIVLPISVALEVRKGKEAVMPFIGKYIMKKVGYEINSAEGSIKKS